jgi:hypothetical protein
VVWRVTVVLQGCYRGVIWCYVCNPFAHFAISEGCHIRLLGNIPALGVLVGVMKPGVFGVLVYSYVMWHR